MSTASAIRFRDPFASHSTYTNNPRSWPSLAHRHDINRALTPPPEMNGVSQQKPVYHRHELINHVGEPLGYQQPFKSSTGSYLPQEMSNAEFGRAGYATQPNSRTMSPVQHTRSHTTDGYVRQHNSRASQANAIAPSFQIPRSVNDSGGSLAELAAQVSSKIGKGSESGHADG